MRERTLVPSLQVFVCILLLLSPLKAQTPGPARSSAPRGVGARTAKVCASCVRAHMEFLASDALRGRGGGSPDEFVAATYAASQLQQYGIKPAGDDGTYIQRGVIIRQQLAAPPQLRFVVPDKPSEATTWTYGKQMLALYLKQAKFRAPLKRIDTDHSRTTEADYKGAVVAIVGKDESSIDRTVGEVMEGGAIAVLVRASERRLKHWDERGRELPALAATIQDGESASLGGESNLFAIHPDAIAQLNEMREGTMVEFDGTVGPPETSYTWNAVGKLPGRDPALRDSAILLTAHLDHLGIGKPVKGDSIYNGADDDASGTTAVLELARTLGAEPRPRRTVIFALFGSEETGGLGSTWFEAHPPVPLANIAANLEFEMIGRPDPKYARDSLWLTGWDRTNLGPVLAAHGARLVADRRPEEQFFARSDNYVLAKKGVVAQTVSSFGLHSDYHQPSDDVAHIDFRHMTAAIESLIAPVEWLANSDFRPAWKKGQKP
jgi:aminopeptidase YwaD